MKKIILFLSLVFGATSCYANAGDELTGDVKLACEAILCLSSSTRPTECNKSLAKYFSISAKKWSKTVTKRKDFLKLCPAADDTAVDNVLESLTTDIAKLKNNCTAEEFNKRIEQRWQKVGGRDGITYSYYRVDPSIPDDCANLAKHIYTDITLPHYVCDDKYIREDIWKRGNVNKKCWVD